MDPITLIAVAVLLVVLAWLLTKGGLTEPFRTGTLVVLIIIIVLIILRMVGMV